MPHGLSAYPQHPPEHCIQSGPSSIATESVHLDLEPATLPVALPRSVLIYSDGCFLEEPPPRLVVTPSHPLAVSLITDRIIRKPPFPTITVTAALPSTTKHIYDVLIAQSASHTPSPKPSHCLPAALSSPVVITSQRKQ